MADGTLIFNTKIDTSGVDSGMLKIENKATKATNAVARQTIAVQKLESEMQRLKTAQVPTEQYAQLESAMQKVDNRLMSLIDQQDKYLATGGTTSGTVWNRMQYDIEKVSAEVREYQAQMATMKSDGSAFTQDSAAITAMSEKLDIAKSKLQELQTKEQEAARDLIAATSPKQPEVINKSLDKAGKSLTKFKNRIKEVLRSALIFTVISQLCAKLRDYLGEVAVKNEEFRTALGKLKGAMKSAFTPILNAALPALTSLINALATAITYISKFFGLIFGGSAGTTAKLSGTTASLMSTAEGTSNALDSETASLMALDDASKDATKSMANFDEINQLSFNKGGGGSGAGEVSIPTLNPDDVELPTWVTKAAEKISEAFGKVYKDIQDHAPEIKRNMKLMFDVSFPELGSVLRGWQNWYNNLPTVQWGNKMFEKLFGKFDIGQWLENSVKNARLDVDAVSAILETALGIVSGDEGKISDGISKWVQVYVQRNAGLLGKILGEEAVSNFLQILQDGKFKEAVSKWWDDHVTPWFSGDKWAELARGGFFGITGALLTWKDSEWAPKVSLWWDNNVSPWFTNEKWFGLANSGFLGIGGAFITWKDTDWYSKISTWWNKDVLPWFTKDKWYQAMTGIKDGFSKAFEDAKAVVKSAINIMIGWLNSFGRLSWEAKMIAGKEIIPAGSITLWNIPQLATGAVIPPNREFLALLGDQKHGTNIEAPLDTIVAAFRQVAGEFNGGKGEAVMEVDGQAFGRLVYKLGSKESKRVGVRLAGV